MKEENLTADVRIGVIGLGYVGLPMAVLFATKYPVTGFDLNPAKVDRINAGLDETGAINPDDLRKVISRGFLCATDEEALRSCNFYVVVVPTPVDIHNTPDLGPLRKASETVGRLISRGDYVVYESTVYPGVTEEECVPIIERVSGLKLNVDFFAGYSPERINPGETTRLPEHIIKVTSGSTAQAAKKINAVYNSVLERGTFIASSIRVAEAAKILENVQRDVNIALMNEAAKIFNAMGIDTHAVLQAAATKWNFMRFSPGLVGGHCISVDPYYLIQKAEVYGLYPRIMSEARRLNDGMGGYVGAQVLRCMNRNGVAIADSRILILGFTFKENCSDVRNTKVIDVVTTLKEYTPNISIYDPWADPSQVKQDYGVDLLPAPPAQEFDAIVLAVAHDQFRDLDLKPLRASKSILYDVKGFWPSGIADGVL